MFFYRLAITLGNGKIRASDEGLLDIPYGYAHRQDGIFANILQFVCLFFNGSFFPL